MTDLIDDDGEIQAEDKNNAIRRSYKRLFTGNGNAKDAQAVLDDLCAVFSISTTTAAATGPNQICPYTMAVNEGARRAVLRILTMSSMDGRAVTQQAIAARVSRQVGRDPNDDDTDDLVDGPDDDDMIGD